MTDKNNAYEDIIIGRQAIFDRNMNVFGYELLHRDGKINVEKEGDKATSRIILNTFLELGLTAVVGDKTAFINLTDTFFQPSALIPFDTNKVVLEVLENVEITDSVITSVKSMHEAGITIALDDYAFEPHWEPLIPYASIIKVEVPAVSIEQVFEHVKDLKNQGIMLLAEKVETYQEFKIYHALGFDLFQGYYFAKPNIVEGKRLSENQLVVIRLLNILNQPEADIDDIEQAIASDPSLSLKILRYINSATMALPRKIESIKQAVVLMGLKRIRALASLITLSQISNKPSELFQIAMIRANMCGELAAHLDPTIEDAAYTIGLLSVLDALMDQKLCDIINEIGLSEELSTSLLEQKGTLGSILGLVISYEKQDWTEIENDLFDADTIRQAWLNSTKKALAAETMQ